MVNNNDRVRLTYWHERVGIVFHAGQEVSEVKWSDGLTINHNNDHLEKISGSPVTYMPPRNSNPKPSSVKSSRKSKLSDTWKATDLKITAKPGSVVHTQATLARKTLEIIKFQEQGGKLNYLSWLFRKGYIMRE